ncbi:type VI secretion system baseplate subunit TssK [Chitinivorax sp. B]|uniref:type VI secretion system baseplate subunit TssK n=1 Tax=Chitinivorax sp. B TaxID=2502235 RepID=UPI0010F8BD71|nr:type VI secretion system baseplate subunit TssK [Chitinivorax sp. B]
MNPASRVLWGEGLFLRPQHFQLQDAYHDAQLAATSRLLHPYCWGVRALQLDSAALAAGVFSLQTLHAVLPDGEWLCAPECDDLPDGLNLTAVADLPDQFLVYIALVPLKPGIANAALLNEPAGKLTRFEQANVEAQDLYTGAVPAEVQLLKHKAVLLTDRHSHEGYIVLPIARVRKSQTGGFDLDSSFIPPATAIESSGTLVQLLRRLLDILQAKVGALYGHHREPGKHVIEFRSGDVASFWLLHTASTAYAGLLHLYQHPQLHPERLYQQLLQLAGSLMTFAKSYTLTDLPSYSHMDLSSCMSRLDMIIRELLETVISARFFSIVLSETKPSYWLGRLDSQKIDTNTRFYLSVGASLQASEIVDTVPIRFKIGSPDDVDKLVLSAMPGVRLIHAAQVPTAIPVRPGSFYFELEPRGPLYERMLQGQAVSIYVPNGFTDLNLELLAVTS